VNVANSVTRAGGVLAPASAAPGSAAADGKIARVVSSPLLGQAKVQQKMPPPRRQAPRHSPRLAARAASGGAAAAAAQQHALLSPHKTIGRAAAGRRGSRSTARPRPVLQTTSRVKVHIYHVSNEDWVKGMNEWLPQSITGGVYHAGVEVWGKEYWFGWCPPPASGVTACHPKRNLAHTYFQSVDVGLTRMSKDDVAVLMSQLKREWPGGQYHAIKRNCCHFCEEMLARLGTDGLPRCDISVAFANSHFICGHCVFFGCSSSSLTWADFGENWQLGQPLSAERKILGRRRELAARVALIVLLTLSDNVMMK
jgi:hypothetical protein